ncbi:MAG: aldehyde dehydrogenase family protein [Chloroflexi bacterium]|nr:aldehyde dehydrogenase family protein [Chloroflexota bacterium]MCI0580735.1 aldehyde dehydrogenase family protein [Chloroflexota bacterium]MCI0650006.1 aldehyde dehydrogenase family protein [Chloroflexota bacterium]MCI0730470.1 aldehyde dehydrogenase family protein [Chloroflexota bacterium]
MSANEVLPFINPATGEQFGQVAMATAGEVAQAQRELRQAFEIWRRKPVKERVRILRKLQAFVIDSVDLITETINQDTGKSRQDALLEVMMTVDRLHQYYRQAPRWLARQRVPPGLYVFRRFYTEPHPYGVVAVIGPWNLPFDLAVPPLCTALLAGNTVLLKPSEVAPATGVLIEKLIQSVPELSPFVRVLHGDGRVGEQIVRSRPDLIFFTGSTNTGRKIARVAAETMTPFLCELGGKDPMIVLEDADLAAAARWGVWGAFYHGGQTCMAVERTYVVESVYDDFLHLVLEETQQLKMGYSPDLDNPNDLGPLTFQRQKQIVEDHLQDALARGARILHGGRSQGLFVEPTIVVDVDHSMKLMRDETFGPVLPVMKVKDEAEAIRLANDSYYGLSACVWSQNLERAQRVAGQLEVGSVNINDAISHYPVSLLPFGGIKDSGTARTHGQPEVLQFTQYRSYAVGQPPLAFDLATHMRRPGNYRLGATIMHLAFGVTPQQRVRPVVQGLNELKEKSKAPAPVTVAAAGALMALAAVLFGLWRHADKRK